MGAYPGNGLETVTGDLSQTAKGYVFFPKGNYTAVEVNIGDARSSDRGQNKRARCEWTPNTDNHVALLGAGN
jgi:hypothetical protein